MKKITCIALLMLAAALPAAALTTNELLSLVAMPLAVAAVCDVNGVPQDQFADLLVTLNDANLPPMQFVEIVRYAPVALSDRQFVPYVQEEVSQGITGPALVTVIDRRLSSYGITRRYATMPATTFVEETDYVVVEPRYDYADPLALIAMPLAVAAVADLTYAPRDQFVSLLVTLNDANVPPAQFVQVVRYAPFALNDREFMPFVQQQVSQGVTGQALFTVIDQRLPNVAPAPLPANFPMQFVETQGGNPHGGPPGQLKKELGLQTGAEVVHGFKPGRQFQQPPMIAGPSSVAVQEGERGHGHGRGHGHADETPMVVAPPGAQPVVAPAPGPPPDHGHGKGNGRGPDGNGPPGQNKEKDHGHGKD